MITVTVVCFGKSQFASEQTGRKKLIVAWVILVLIQLAAMLWTRSGLYRYLMDNIFEMAFVFRVITIVFDWAKIVAFTVALVFISRYIKLQKPK